MKNGWYKMTLLPNVMVLHFENDLAHNGYDAAAYERMGYSFEPVVVMTQDEYDNTIVKIQKTAYHYGYIAGQGYKG